MSNTESMHRFSQTLRELSFLAGRVAGEMEAQEWARQHQGAALGHAWPLESGPMEEYVPQALVDPTPELPEASVAVPETRAEAPRLSYPRLVDKTTIDWATLRLVATSKLSALLREGVYHPRVVSDKGYMWLAEQVGSSGSIRAFLVDPNRQLTAENFIRLCQWLGEDPAEFIDYHEGI